MGQPVGGIQVGQRADFIELDMEHPQAVGKNDNELLDSFVFAGNPDMIRSVWVAGEKVIDQGIHHREDAMRSAFIEAVRELLQ